MPENDIGVPALPEGSDWRREVAVLVVAFTTFRLLTVLFFKPGGEVYLGGLDYRFYWEMAELSLEGHYPYLDFWVEYPPLFPWALVGLYKASLLLPAWSSPILWFQSLTGVFLLCFDVGNLLLVVALARRLHGPRLGLRAGWLYAILFLPVYVLTNWFDVFPLFFLLLGLWAALAGRPIVAGLALGGGLMAKVIPAIVAPLVFLALPRWRGRIRFTLAAVITALVIVAPFSVLNRDMMVASFTSMFARSSWLTPWALLEGYFDVGYMPPWAFRFDPAAAAWQKHPQTLPWLAINGWFAVYLLALLTRRLAWNEPRVLIPAAGLALNVLLVFSKGWSPAFMLYVLPFLVIVFPGPLGLTYATLLTFVNFLEWPLAGVYFRDERWLWWTVVLARSTLFVLVGWEYVTQLNLRLLSRWQSVRRAWRLPAAVALALAVGLGGWALADRYRSSGPLMPVVDYVRGLSTPGQLFVATSREAFYALKPLFAEDRFASPRDDLWSDQQATAATLEALARGVPQAWVVLDHARGEAARRDAITAWFDAWGARATDVWFGTYQLVGYMPYARPQGATASAVGAEFGGEVTLEGWNGGASLRRGEPLRIVLHWRADGPVTGEPKVYLHLADEAGNVVAQRDRPLGAALEAPGGSEAGAAVQEAYDVVVPADAPAGRYTVVVGLYDPESGQRLLTYDEGTRRDGVVLGTWELA